MHHDVADLGELRFPRQMLLWAVRQWTHVEAARGPQGLVSEAFTRLQMHGACAQLDAMLCSLLGDTPRPLCWRCPSATMVSDDEMLLLDSIGLLQVQAHDCVAVRWSLMWPAATVGVALTYAAQLAIQFADAGLILGAPDRVAAVTRPLVHSARLH